MRYSVNDIEYALFEELKSDQYAPFVRAFNQSGIEYPPVHIEVCPARRRNIMLRNRAVTYEPGGRIQVCRNYIVSKQILREEFRRENTLAYDHLVLKKSIASDANSLACSFVRACRAEMEAALEYSSGGRKT
jgi:hypothetical protein